MCGHQPAALPTADRGSELWCALFLSSSMSWALRVDARVRVATGSFGCSKKGITC